MLVEDVRRTKRQKENKTEEGHGRTKEKNEV